MKEDVKQNILACISDFLSDSDQWGTAVSGTGAVYRLEKSFSNLFGHPYALAVANATVGLWAVFQALEIHGAEIITTPYTWGGTIAGLIQSGNVPVFADIDKETLTLDPEKVRGVITSKTRAILTVDIYGYPSNGSALREIADEYGLFLIQDCAQSFGAFVGGLHTGWWADFAVFSVGWQKVLYAGEGGVIVIKNDNLFQDLVFITQHMQRQLRDCSGRMTNEMALNLRMNPLSAVWADSVFDKALREVEEIRFISFEVLRLLKNEKLILTGLADFDEVKPSFHAVTFESDFGPALIEEFLKSSFGFDCNVTSPPIVEPLYCHQAFRKYKEKFHWGETNNCPIAESACRNRLQIKFQDKLVMNLNKSFEFCNEV